MMSLLNRDVRNSMKMHLSWVFVLVALLFNAGAARAQDVRIPATRATSLSGETISLPEMLHGRVGILVLGFSQGSREAVTEWGRRLASKYRESPSVVYYEMPMLASAPRFVRGFIVKSMKSSVPERAQARFVPLTADEAAWRSVVHYSKADDAYVLVVDDHGTVRWQTKGDATDSTVKLVVQQVEILQAG